MEFSKQQDIVTCKGIELCRPVVSKISVRKRIQNEPLLEVQQFIHYKDSNILKSSFKKSSKQHWKLFSKTPLVFFPLRQLKICEIISKHSKSGLSDAVKKILMNKPVAVSLFVKKDAGVINEKYDLLLLTDASIINEFSLEDRLFQDGLVIYRKDEPLKSEKSTLCDIFFFRNGIRQTASSTENYNKFEAMRCCSC